MYPGSDHEYRFDDVPRVTDSSEIRAQDLAKGIQTLVVDAKRIDQCFRDIYTALGEIDADKSIIPKFRNIISSKPQSPLQPRWTELMTKYRTLLWESKTTAAELATYLEDLNDVVLPSITSALKKDVDFETVMRELQRRTKEAQEKEKEKSSNQEKCQSHSSSFTDLRYEVSGFLMQNQSRIEKFKTQNGKPLMHEFMSIKLCTFRLTLAIKFVRHGMMTFIGASPSNDCFPANTLLNEICSSSRTYSTHANTQEHNQEFDKLKAQFADISLGLDNFAEFWNLIVKKNTDIESYLRQCKTSTARIYLQSRLDKLKAGHKQLYSALTEYAEMVDRSEVEKPKKVY